MKKRIRKLVERQQPGFSLEQPFYRSDEIFELDLQQVLSRQWLYVDHISSLPNPGDFLTYGLANESIIVVRDMAGELHAHFNVCRHRGSRICLEASGNVKRLVCGYHSWAYNLDGSLSRARQMKADFDPQQHGLHSCRLEVLDGFIFINLNSEGAADFQQLADNVRPFIKPHGVSNTKIAHSATYTIAANWKLVVENFRECYHCSSAHPEYSSINAYVRIGDRKLGAYLPLVEQWREEHAHPDREAGFKNFPNALQPHHAWRMPIRDGFNTATKDGTPAAPLLGNFDSYDGAETGVFFSPLSYFYLNNDYITTFRVTPETPTSTDVTVSWLVDKDAIEGEDYQVEHLTWMWHETTVQDARITSDNQKGVLSSRYQPGPYSEREYGTADFAAWYIARLRGKQDSRVAFRK